MSNVNAKLLRQSVLLAGLALAGCARELEVPRLVLLLSSDTLRADRLGSYGSDRDLTPSLDRLAAESVVFEHAYAPAPFTVPSVTTMLSGRYPTQNAVLSNEDALPQGVATLAGELRGAGFATGAVVSNWVLNRGTGLDRGFDEYDDRMQGRERVRALRERIAPATTRDALACLDRLRAGGAPIFLWVHYQDPHGPYTPPSELLEGTLAEERRRPGAERELAFGTDHGGLGTIPTYQRLGDERSVGRYLAAYHAEIRFADIEIGRLLDGLRERGLYDDACIVFVADHGEGLGENDYWFAHGEYLSDSLVRVPLFVRRPAGAAGRRAEVVSLTDLMPTLLELCGVRVPPGLAGRDLFAPGASERPSPVLLATLAASSVPRLGLVRDGCRYVATLDAEGQVAHEELYRVGDESRDLAPNDPRVEQLRAALQTMWQQMKPTQPEAYRELDENERRTLDALGYGGGKGD